VSVFCYRSILSASPSAVFGWHERPDAIEQLLPSRLVRVVHRSGGIRDGGRVVLALGAGPLSVRWEARHFGYVRDRQFCDEQLSGPFSRWRHTHRVEPVGPSQTLYEDRVEYALPGGRIVNWAAGIVMRPLFRMSFARRHAVVRAAVETPSRRPHPGQPAIARGRSC
jgi:ligand-binding SRPBCC domain-containing protein